MLVVTIPRQLRAQTQQRVRAEQDERRALHDLPLVRVSTGEKCPSCSGLIDITAACRCSS